MLLNELILSKRGPLAKVWLSAHHERKLSKQQALGVDVGESVEAILTQEDGPVTLRLSGQLMLGVTRIYSRKAQYLFEDCKETRENITRTFRPGVVDLPEDQQRISNNAITLSDTRNDFDFFDWSWSSALPPVPAVRASPGPARQHLRNQTREYGAYNFGRIAAGSIYGGSTPSRQSHDGDNTSKLDSQDFSGIDLQLDLDNPDMGTPEIARRNTTPQSHRSFSQFRAGSRDKSLTRDMGGLDTFEPIDLGLDLDMPALPDLEPRERRESSALSTPPPASPPPGLNDITPRTAAKIAGLPEPRDRSSPIAPKAKKARLVQADDELELDDAEYAPNRNNSDILAAERYIPADATITQLREIMDDPAAYFLPSLKQGADNLFYVGPQGLAPELEGLFTFPANILRKRSDTSQQDERQSKRQRVHGEEEEEQAAADEEAEVGRRDSVLPSERGAIGFQGYDSGFFVGDQTLGDDMPPMDDFGGLDIEAEKRRLRTPSVAPSVTESIARQIQNDRSAGSHPLAIFEKESRDDVLSQAQVTPSKSVVSEPISKTSSGRSRNTGMAMGLLRREIEAIEEEDKVVGFDKLADKASKRAASAFFFELLVLGTKDAVKLEQTKAFGDIQIRGKDKLFAEIAV